LIMADSADEAYYSPDPTPIPDSRDHETQLIDQDVIAPGDKRVDPILQQFWITVKRIPRYVRLGANLARDDRVPFPAKAMVAGSGAYAISPIDLVPGIIPILGQSDDLIVLLLSLRYALRLCPAEVVDEQLQRAGLTAADIDNDLSTAAATVIWIGRKGIGYASRFMHRTANLSWTAAKWSGDRLRQLRK
jgi:uncharacterized membrane protein YkvA (DUF1232 family)